MGRPPCCDKTNVKRGLWTAEEDAKILAYVASHGVGNWTLVPQKAGLNRCGKSCRLRWTNYLRPDLKHEGFTPEEEDYIIELHKAVGSRWSLIAKQLPGRTDNDVKNYWNTKLKKKLVNMGIDPITHKSISRVVNDCHNIINCTTQTASYNKLIRHQQQTMRSSGLLSLTAPTTYLSDFNYQPQMQPPLYVPQSPTASSSSSCTVITQQQHQVECFPGTNSAGAAQPSIFGWIDHVLQDTVVCVNDDVTCCTTANIVQGSFSNMPPVSGGHGTSSNFFEGCSSSSSSFVDNILDRDLEIMSDCPRLLDESCEYY